MGRPPQETLCPALFRLLSRLWPFQKPFGLLMVPCILDHFRLLEIFSGLDLWFSACNSATASALDHSSEHDIYSRLEKQKTKQNNENSTTCWLLFTFTLLVYDRVFANSWLDPHLKPSYVDKHQLKSIYNVWQVDTMSTDMLDGMFSI